MRIFWNPAGASFEEAAKAIGVAAGTVGILGGPDVYSLFLKMGYDNFYLCRAPDVRFPAACRSSPRGARARRRGDSGVGLKPGPLQTSG